jgi:hypothetical protein
MKDHGHSYKFHLNNYFNEPFECGDDGNFKVQM